MPLCQSALVGLFASEATKIALDTLTDWEESSKQLVRAASTAALGGATAVVTVDPVGGAIVAAHTVFHLICAATGYEPEGGGPPTIEHA
jgi:hypothetical protein